MRKNTVINKKEIGALLFFAIAFFQFNFVSAQYVSRLGKFKVDQIRGCAPLAITLTDISGECATKPCNMFFEGNNNAEYNSFSHTYTTPGTYTLSVLYNDAIADDLTITIDADVKPVFEIYACNGNSVSIKVTDKTYDQYFIDFGDGSAIVTKPASNNVVAQHPYTSSGNQLISVQGKKNNAASNCSSLTKSFNAIPILPVAQLGTLNSIDKNNLKIDFSPTTYIPYKLEIAQNGISNFQQLQTLYGTSTYTTTAVDLDKNFYCFQLGTYDACTGVNKYSSIACSQIASLDIKSGENTVTWTSNSIGVNTVSIYRNSVNYVDVLYNPAAYSDPFPNITCNTDYNYYVVFNYATGTKSISLQKSGKSFYTLTPNAIADVSSVTDGQSVTLTWLANTAQDPLLTPNTYSILKSTNKSTYTTIASLPKPLTYLDNSYLAQNNICYKINYTDVCSNKSAEGVIACPLVLQGSINKKNAVTLEWSAYTGWQNGVKSYQIDKFTKDGTLLNSSKVTTTSFIDDQADLTNQTILYKITAFANTNSLLPSTSNIITLTKEANLFYPNVFTPNGDGLNDTFTVSGQFIDKMDLKVYDRWGGLLYSTEKNEPWSGFLNGKLLNEGAYIWKAIVTDLSGQTFSHTGTILLLTKTK